MSLSHLQMDFLLKGSETERYFQFNYDQLLLPILISRFINTTLSLLSHPLHRSDARTFHIPVEGLAKGNVL
jgi:hypothetical protein